MHQQDDTLVSSNPGPSVPIARNQFPMTATHLTSRKSQRKIPIPEYIHKSYRRRYQMTRIIEIPYSNLQKEHQKERKKEHKWKKTSDDKSPFRKV